MKVGKNMTEVLDIARVGEKGQVTIPERNQSGGIPICKLSPHNVRAPYLRLDARPAYLFSK